MPNDKNYSKLDTEFQSFQAAPAPSPSTQEGTNHNPGVCRALNIPASDSRIKTTTYYTPGGPAPTLEASATERIDTLFEQISNQSIGGYAWHPGDDGRPHGSGSVESTMNNPLSQSWGAPSPKPMPPTPPGAPNNYGGGQSSGVGTPPGPELEYGGGQNVGGGATPSGSSDGYGGGQGPAR